MFVCELVLLFMLSALLLLQQSPLQSPVQSIVELEFFHGILLTRTYLEPAHVVYLCAECQGCDDVNQGEKNPEPGSVLSKDLQSRRVDREDYQGFFFFVNSTKC